MKNKSSSYVWLKDEKDKQKNKPK
ncbi:hypothetical protein EZS27_023254, partial [termite gut metagenome]